MKLYFKKILYVVVFLALFLFSDFAYSFSCEPSDRFQKVFILGRGVGASYYHLIDLYDKAGTKPYSELQKEYREVFQNFNVIDIILEDLSITGQSASILRKLRYSFYNSLNQQDLNETQLAFVRDMFVIFYENLTRDIQCSYSNKGSWLLSLGFYSSFQLESLNSDKQEKLLLSGFNKILLSRPVTVPTDVYSSLMKINSLDKTTVTEGELFLLKKELENVTAYFSNFPERKKLFQEKQELIGLWQGILINPDKKRYDIRLAVDSSLNASMDIDGIATNVQVSEIKLVDDYFTFMFKPFGTEKLYIRFNARLSEGIFTGEIVDVVGEKGFWVLARTGEDYKLSEMNLNKMTSYIDEIDKKLLENQLDNEENFIVVNNQAPVSEGKNDLSIAYEAESIEHEFIEAFEEFSDDHLNTENVETPVSEPIIVSEPGEAEDSSLEKDQASVEPSEKSELTPAVNVQTEETKTGTGVIKKLKNLFKRLFSFYNTG